MSRYGEARMAGPGAATAAAAGGTLDYETVALSDDGKTVTLLDQRQLPHTVTYVHLTTAVAVADAIRSMVVRGAPAIGATAAYGLAIGATAAAAGHPSDDAAFRDDLAAAASVLRASRPTAVNLEWALDRLLRLVTPADGGGGGGGAKQSSPAAVAAALTADARAIAREDVDINRRMGALGAALLPPAARILHHCNTGALATVGHGTALGVIRSAYAADPGVSVWVNETRPRLQGARLTAWELAAAGIPHTLAVDSAAAVLLRDGRVDAVTVGADRVAANGDTANKIGTLAVAISAGHYNVPFYVVAPASTVDLACATGAGIPVEERGAEEVTHPCGGRGTDGVAPPGTRVFNPAFDVTSASLITAIVTEEGVARPPFSESLPPLVAAAAAKVQR